MLQGQTPALNMFNQLDSLWKSSQKYTEIINATILILSARKSNIKFETSTLELSPFDDG